MSNAVLRNIFEAQKGESLPSAFQRIHNALPALRTDQEWIEAIAKEFGGLNLNDPLYVYELAAKMQKLEKNSRNLTAPGKGTTLELDLMTREWADEAVIILPENESICVPDAKTEHFQIAQMHRMQKAIDAQNAAMRMAEIVTLSMEPGGLPGALRRRSIPGW